VRLLPTRGGNGHHDPELVQITPKRRDVR
jgi:hypothetical protein